MGCAFNRPGVLSLGGCKGLTSRHIVSFSWLPALALEHCPICVSGFSGKSWEFVITIIIIINSSHHLADISIHQKPHKVLFLPSQQPSEVVIMVTILRWRH